MKLTKQSLKEIQLCIHVFVVAAPTLAFNPILAGFVTVSLDDFAAKLVRSRKASDPDGLALFCCVSFLGTADFLVCIIIYKMCIGNDTIGNV